MADPLSSDERSLRRPDYVVEVFHSIRIDPATMGFLMGLFKGLANNPQLDRIERTLKTMSNETRQVLAAIDTETTRIAVAIEALIAGSNDTELKAGLQAHLDRLKGIASNPEEPIPAV